jgi:hypothetical protein
VPTTSNQVNSVPGAIFSNLQRRLQHCKGNQAVCCIPTNLLTFVRHCKLLTSSHLVQPSMTLSVVHSDRCVARRAWLKPAASTAPSTVRLSLTAANVTWSITVWPPLPKSDTTARQTIDSSAGQSVK